MSYRAKIGVPEDFEQSIFDENNPYSMVNKLPEGWQEFLHSAKEYILKFYTKSDIEITKLIGDKITEKEMRMRLALWDEYYRVSDVGFQRMRSIVILRSASTSMDMFRKRYAHEPQVLAFLFTAPASYLGSMKQILQEGQQRLLDIMRLPLQDENGKVNTPVLNAVLKTFQLVDLRLKGSVVQRLQVDQRTFNASIDLNADQLNNAQLEALKGMDVAELELLERKINAAEKITKSNVELLPADLQMRADEVMRDLPRNERFDYVKTGTSVENQYIDYVEETPVE